MSRQSQCPNGLGISFLPLIFSLLLTLVAISHAEAQTCVQPPSDLVSWWPGDGNADDLQNVNDGMLQGEATFDTGMVGQAFVGAHLNVSGYRAIARSVSAN